MTEVTNTIKKRNWPAHRQELIVAILIAIAYLCSMQRRMGLGNQWNLLFKPLRVSICMGLFIYWGISIQRRIINRRLKDDLMIIDGMVIFWFTILTVQDYFVIHQGMISRAIWYGSYIPQLMIPTFMLFAAMHVRRADSYRLPGWTWIITAISVAFVAGILTNDYHFLFFRPRVSVDMMESYYVLMPVYWAAIVWIFALVAVSVLIIIARCRTPYSLMAAKLPLGLILIVSVYFLLYFAVPSDISWLMGDRSVALCLASIGIVESCIRTGLIPSNTGYDKLFAAMGMGITITDNQWHIRYRTDSASDILEEMLKRTMYDTVPLDQDTQLRGFRIRGGYAVWEQDISEMAAVLDRLRQNSLELQERNYLDEQTYRTVSSLRQAQEKNRLFNRLQSETRSQNESLHKYLHEYRETADEGEKRKILGKSAVVAAYIKRKGNLIFAGEKSEIITTNELYLCFQESMQNLELLGTECCLEIHIPGGLRISSARRLYDIFECALEQLLDDCSLCSVTIGDRNGKIAFLMECESGGELCMNEYPEVRTEREDGIWRIICRIDDSAGGEGGRS